MSPFTTPPCDRHPSVTLRTAPSGAVLHLRRLAIVVAIMTTAPAAADIRIWQDGGPAGEDGAPSAAPDRYLDLTAFAQPGFILRTDDPLAGVTEDSFWLQRARLGLRAQIHPWLRARMEVELSGNVLLQDAFLEVTPHPAFNVRAGQFLIPFLRAFAFNELNLGFLDRPVYVPINPDRSFIRFLNARDVGLMFHGLIGDPSPDSTAPVLSYEVGAFVGRGPNVAQNSDGVFLWAARVQLHVLGMPEGAERESDLARNHNPRVAVATAIYSNCDDRGNWNRGFDVDAEFRWEGLYASAGFVWFRNSPGDAFFAPRESCRGNLDAAGNPLDFVSRGAHLQVQYVLHPALFPVTGMALEVLGRIDLADPNSPHDPSNGLFGGDSNSPGYLAPTQINDSDNPPTRWRLTVGANWYPTSEQHIRLGFNYQHTVETEDMRVPDGIVHQVQNDTLWLQLTAGI